MAFEPGKKGAEFEEEDTEDLELSGCLKLEDLSSGSGKSVVGGVEEEGVVLAESGFEEFLEKEVC